MRIKLILASLLTAVLSAGFAFYLFVENVPQSPADVVQLSASRQYLVERVPLRVFWPGEPLAYLRVTDLDASGNIYRSPLHTIRQMNMKLLVSPETVGIAGIDFDKKQKYFVLRVDQWKEHWLNRFVSNTAYSVEVPMGQGRP